MASYFRQIPNLQYPSRGGESNISDYVTLKNLFKRATIREDIFANVVFFTKYQIKGNDRPDNVAFELYGDETLDWLVLLSNNILNIQTEWPLSQDGFSNFLMDKYGSEEEFVSTHHYETIQVLNSVGQIIVPKGLKVPENFVASYYDIGLSDYISRSNVVERVTNYEYEDAIQTKKRSIFTLKPRYLNIILDDLEAIMAYQRGSTQYVSETLKRTDNTRLYG